MKRTVVLSLAVFVLLVLAPLASASKSGWSDQGSGSPMTSPTASWQWSANSDVGGANVSGHFSEKDSATNTYFSGDVFCLSVASTAPQHTARIGVLITQSNTASRPVGSWTYFVMQTNDGSHPVNVVGVDTTLFGPLPTVCPPPAGFVANFEGNINIRP